MAIYLGATELSTGGGGGGGFTKMKRYSTSRSGNAFPNKTVYNTNVSGTTFDQQYSGSTGANIGFNTITPAPPSGVTDLLNYCIDFNGNWRGLITATDAAKSNTGHPDVTITPAAGQTVGNGTSWTAVIRQSPAKFNPNSTTSGSRTTLDVYPQDSQGSGSGTAGHTMGGWDAGDFVGFTITIPIDGNRTVTASTASNSYGLVTLTLDSSISASTNTNDMLAATVPSSGAIADKFAAIDAAASGSILVNPATDLGLVDGSQLGYFIVSAGQRKSAADYGALGGLILQGMATITTAATNLTLLPATASTSYDTYVHSTISGGLTLTSADGTGLSSWGAFNENSKLASAGCGINGFGAGGAAVPSNTGIITGGIDGALYHGYGGGSKGGGPTGGDGSITFYY